MPGVSIFLHHGRELTEQAREIVDRFAFLGSRLGKVVHLPMTQNSEPVAQNFEAKIDLVLVGSGRGESGDALLETIKLRDRLAYGPNHVVAGDFTYRLLLLEDGERHADPRHRENHDADGEKRLDELGACSRSRPLSAPAHRSPAARRQRAYFTSIRATCQAERL